MPDLVYKNLFTAGQIFFCLIPHIIQPDVHTHRQQVAGQLADVDDNIAVVEVYVCLAVEAGCRAVYKAVQNIGDAPRFRGGGQDGVQVTQNRHFAVLAGALWVIQTGIVVGDTLIAVGGDNGLIQKLALLVAQIGDQQREEDVQLLDFGGLLRLLRHGTIQQFAAGVVDFANFHDVDTVRAARHDTDNGAVQRLGLTVKLVSFQRGNDVNRCSRQPHTPGDQLHGERLACAGGAENRHVCVFVDTGVEVVEADKRVIVLVHAQQYAVCIA